MMNGGILVLCLLFLLTLASQAASWRGADSSIIISADHLQVQEFHGEKNLEIQNLRKLGHGQSLTKQEASTIEIKHHRRTALGHKGGSAVGGGGGGAVTRPHNTKNGAAALSVPVASALTLTLASGLALSVFIF